MGIAVRNANRGHLTHEQIVGIGHITTNPEELHKVVELPVNVTAYLRTASQPLVSFLPVKHSSLVTYRHRRIHSHHVSLLDKQLPRLVAKFAHLGFGYRATSSKLCYRSETCKCLADRV